MRDLQVDQDAPGIVDPMTARQLQDAGPDARIGIAVAEALDLVPDASQPGAKDLYDLGDDPLVAHQEALEIGPADDGDLAVLHGRHRGG